MIWLVVFVRVSFVKTGLVTVLTTGCVAVPVIEMLRPAATLSTKPEPSTFWLGQLPDTTMPPDPVIPGVVEPLPPRLIGSGVTDPITPAVDVTTPVATPVRSKPANVGELVVWMPCTVSSDNVPAPIVLVKLADTPSRPTLG